ncbi:MAG: hypothetical protein SV775_07435 [Thermodesulfobacteriota bacterium]|nr:hypothetical protein [Thermodesulfobacteriota bacterium]
MKLMVLVLALPFCLQIISVSWAGRVEDQQRRLLLGLNFFPNVVAVDEDILAKSTASGKLRLVLVYSDDRERAERLARRLKRKVRTVKRAPVEIAVTDDPVREFSPSNRPAGLFLTEWFSDPAFQKIIRFGIREQLIVFSPFVGDVERGATAGLYIGTKIRPSLNLSTLQASDIRIHKVFRRLSKHYE